VHRLEQWRIGPGVNARVNTHASLQCRTGGGLSAADVAVIALTAVGSIAEGAGIVMVAGRVSDLKTYVRTQVNTARQRYVAGQATLRGFFPRPPRLHLRGLETDVVIDHVPPGGAHAGGLAPAVLETPDTALEERVAALEDRQTRLEQRMNRLERALPDQIQEEIKDPWWGLGLLFGGLACLLAAGILGAITS
jgi:hypothetical protein